MPSINLTKRDNSISLTKGATINLTKTASSLSNLLIGLSWKPANPSDYKAVEKVPTTFGSKIKRFVFGPEYNTDTVPEGVRKNFDLDAYAICLVDGRCIDRDDIVYYGNLKHKSSAITHLGDNLIGGGDGDSEQIILNLDKLPSKYDKILIGVNIFNAGEKRQNFGLIKGTAMRIVDVTKNEELCSYKEDKISNELADCTNMFFGILYKDKQTGAWNFEAIGKGNRGGRIENIALSYQYSGEH